MLAVEAVICELVSAFSLFAVKYREILLISARNDSSRSFSYWKFNRLPAEFPKHQIREVVRRNRERKPSSRENWEENRQSGNVTTMNEPISI